jgi:hypothetical protein
MAQRALAKRLSHWPAGDYEIGPKGLIFLGKMLHICREMRKMRALLGLAPELRHVCLSLI